MLRPLQSTQKAKTKTTYVVLPITPQKSYTIYLLKQYIPFSFFCTYIHNLLTNTETKTTILVFIYNIHNLDIIKHKQKSLF